jgi:hypothetical protein
MTRLALAVQSPSTITRRGGLHYVRGALASPVCVASTVFATCVGISCAGTLGAMLAVTAIISLCIMMARFGIVRRYLDRQGVYVEIAKREASRLRQLRPAGPARVQQYGELRRLVEEIENSDPAEAERFELQDLLDHYTRISVSHYKCLEALRFAHDTSLATQPLRAGRRRQILDRRVAHRDACLRRVERLGDELEAIDELIRLCAQRVACPELDLDLDREIDRRLWELDEVDAALTRLSA